MSARPGPCGLCLESSWSSVSWNGDRGKAQLAAAYQVLRDVRQRPLRSVDREVAGRNNSERQDSPEIDRGGSSRPYPVTGKAETLDAAGQVSRDASGVRTASMQPKEFMGTRESRQVQA